MGLCKCQRRKVTNLFCFEHDVNVCEYCLVADHERVYFNFIYFLIQYLFIFIITTNVSFYNNNLNSALFNRMFSGSRTATTIQYAFYANSSSRTSPLFV
jgi:hypothetical protein